MRRPTRADDLADDPHQVAFVGEAGLGFLDLAAPLDEDDRRGVDHDVGDRRVLEQRLQRPEPEQLVEDVLDQLLALGRG